MNRRLALGAVACAATLGLGLASAPAAQARPEPFTLAVIGDIPYTAAQVTAFPGVVDQLNADRKVRLVAHLGDIKSGSTPCSDEYFAFVRGQFDRFSDPLVYTPGDNEWTDCHRPAAGGYDPLERLSALRSTFFDRPGRTLGAPARVGSQARRGFPENVSFERAGVPFAALHVVGSNNSLVPWTGRTAPTPEQLAEQQARTAAAVSLVRSTFREAREDKAPALVLMLQADMFDPSLPKDPALFSGYADVVRTIATESARFRKPVYLLNGDSHVFTVDRPLSASSPWAALYGLPPVENVTRVTVDGSDFATNYLRVTVDPRSAAVLTWEKVPFTS